MTKMLSLRITETHKFCIESCLKVQKITKNDIVLKAIARFWKRESEIEELGFDNHERLLPERITIKLPDDIYLKVKKYSEDKNKSVSAVIRIALNILIWSVIEANADKSMSELFQNFRID